MNGLVVSTTVRVVDRVHGHTGNVRVELATGLGLVVGSTGGSPVSYTHLTLPTIE